MDSDTYRRPAADQKRSVGGARHRLPDTRYPHFAHGADDGTHGPTGSHGPIAGSHGAVSARRDDLAGTRTGGRLRTAMLIVFAVVALSAIAAVGWMQYQSREREDPQFEISEPDRSVPALAKSAVR